MIALFLPSLFLPAILSVSFFWGTYLNSEFSLAAHIAIGFILGLSFLQIFREWYQTSYTILCNDKGLQVSVNNCPYTQYLWDELMCVRYLNQNGEVLKIYNTNKQAFIIIKVNTLFTPKNADKFDGLLDRLTQNNWIKANEKIVAGYAGMKSADFFNPKYIQLAGTFKSPGGLGK